ncbi:MAG: nucleotide kinase, partial [Pseudoflavonifractor sp.]
MGHIFLTGAVRCGKSTVINGVLARTALTVGGFRTAFGPDRALPERCLYLFPAGGAPAFDEAHVVVRYGANRPGAIPQRFDALGVATLTEGTPQLLIMD